jgi:hypothetical protein
MRRDDMVNAMKMKAGRMVGVVFILAVIVVVN